MAPRRKSLRDAPALTELLSRHAPDVVLHGHLHSNQEKIGTPTRIFCTAPPSSERLTAPASYRVFDVTEDAAGCRVVMRLKSRVGEEMVVADEQTWLADRSLDPTQRDDAANQ